IISHCQPEPLKHEPCGFLRDLQSVCQFVATDSILTVGEKPHSWQPLFKANWRILEDGSDFQSELRTCVFVVALPASLIGQISDFFRLASRATHKAIRPAHFDHKAMAVFVVAEVDNRVS